MDPKVAQVVAAGREVGVDVVPRTFPAETRTAVDAAAAVGCDVAQIVKSLVLESPDGPLLFLVGGPNRLDLAKAAAVAGVGEVTLASATRAKAITGYSIGATPPFGLATAVPVFVDEDLMAHAEVWAAAGRPDSVFPTEPGRLVQATKARVANIKDER
ncbi:MAG TPA: YbaK/EbsC family protein [Actinomycetota bacterium]|nr:YbaK/EbsC family protein [Actinomycetota bacterium]